MHPSILSVSLVFNPVLDYIVYLLHDRLSSPLKYPTPTCRKIEKTGFNLFRLKTYLADQKDYPGWKSFRARGTAKISGIKDRFPCVGHA